MTPVHNGPAKNTILIWKGDMSVFYLYVSPPFERSEQPA